MTSVARFDFMTVLTLAAGDRWSASYGNGSRFLRGREF